MLGPRGREFIAWLRAQGLQTPGTFQFGQRWQCQGVASSEAMAFCILSHAEEIDRICTGAFSGH
eukprot:7066221-Lingulodinium_polyedra.AAC.1